MYKKALDSLKNYQKELKNGLETEKVTGIGKKIAQQLHESFCCFLLFLLIKINDVIIKTTTNITITK